MASGVDTHRLMSFEKPRIPCGWNVCARANININVPFSALCTDHSLCLPELGTCTFTSCHTGLPLYEHLMRHVVSTQKRFPLCTS